QDFLAVVITAVGPRPKDTGDTCLVPASSMSCCCQVMIDMDLGLAKDSTQGVGYLCFPIGGGATCPIKINFLYLAFQIYEKVVTHLDRHLLGGHVVGIKSHSSMLADLAIPMDNPPVCFARTAVCN